MRLRLRAFGILATGATQLCCGAGHATPIEVNPGVSLAAVRDRIRSLPEEVKSNGVEIVLAPGDYFLPGGLSFCAVDSGVSEDRPIVWRASGRGRVRLLGADVVAASRFARVTDPTVLARLPQEARGSVVSADISDAMPGRTPPFPDAFIGVPPAPLVTVAGRFATLAKWPNGDGWAVFTNRIDQGVLKKDGLYWNGAFRYSDRRARRWNVAEGVWLNGYWTHDWNNASVKIGRYGSENGTNDVVRLAAGVPYGVMGKTWGGFAGRRFRAFNLLDELDEPGEYWLDRSVQRLYLVLQRPGHVPEVRFGMSEKPLLHFSRAANLRFEGLELSYNYGNLVTGDSCTAIVFVNCRLTHTAHGGISISGMRNRIVHCEIGPCGTYGVSISGGDRRRLVRSESLVENCRIHDFGIYQRTYAPGIRLDGVGVTVRGNELHSAPHVAILYGGNEMRIESNDIHHVLLETADAGAVYTGRDWTTQGNCLADNFVHELGPTGRESFTMGFYFDDCDCGDAVYGNVFWKVACGILVGGGRDHPIRNNVFAECKTGISIDNRGMTWKQWNNRAVGGPSWMLEDKAKALRYTEEPWKSRYPSLANIMNDAPREPLYNPVEDNVFIDCTNHLVQLPGKTIDSVLPKMTFRSNLVYVSSRAVKSAEPDSRIAGAFVCLTQGVEAGFLDSRHGVFRLKPNADVIRRLPAFRARRCRSPWNLTCERQPDPVGIDSAKPRLSWMLPEDFRSQCAYEIEADGWKSGPVASSQQTDVPWGGPPLVTSQRISWRVRVWDAEGKVSAWSERATFVMGVVKATDWAASWIGPNAATRGPGADGERASPAFEKTFTVSEPVSRATLHVTGLGFYEAFLNGKRIGSKVLDPSPTDYGKRVLYSTYCLDDAVAVGENVLRIVLGHGWYDMRSRAIWNFHDAPWRAPPKAIARLDVVYRNGSGETIVTDDSWRQVDSPVIFDDLREGAVVGWRRDEHLRVPPGTKAAKVCGPGGGLEAECLPAARVTDVIPPARIVRDSKGRWIVSFPESLSGWVHVDFRGMTNGEEVAIRYDENLTPDGGVTVSSRRKGHDPKKNGRPDERFIDMFYFGGAGTNFVKGATGMQTDHFIASGAPEERFEPKFVYHGFMHLVIDGYRGELRKDDVRAHSVRTDFPEVGSFACSDATLTELVRMALNSYRANFTDGIPTDCPHREKLGWTGDAWVASEFAQYFFENTAAYEKWLRDVIDTQLTNGELCCIAPTAGCGYTWGNGPVFDAVLAMLPWHLWMYRADRQALDRTYAPLVRYLSYLKTIETGPGLVNKGLGDWNAHDRSRAPENEYVISCLYLRMLEIAANIARLKGLESDATSFADRAATTRRSLNAKYGHGDGTYANGVQTAQAMAVMFGLPSAGERSAVAKKLVEAAETMDGGEINFGLMGSKWFFRALSEIGRTDLAFRMLIRPGRHSPAKWIGKTGTLWEDLHFGLSKCHVMLGDFAAWAMQYPVGITPVEPGFRKMRIAPHVIPELTWVEGKTGTPYGDVRVSWKTQGTEFSLEVDIPPGTTAEVRLPSGRTTWVAPGHHVLTEKEERTWKNGL